jgi:hypothetical protein
VVYLSFRLITLAGHSAHLAYHVCTKVSVKQQEVIFLGFNINQFAVMLKMVHFVAMSPVLYIGQLL